MREVKVLNLLLDSYARKSIKTILNFLKLFCKISEKFKKAFFAIKLKFSIKTTKFYKISSNKLMKKTKKIAEIKKDLYHKFCSKEYVAFHPKIS